MTKGDRIQLNNTSLQGIVTEILPGGIVVVLLDNGIEMRSPADCITLSPQKEGCKNNNTERDENGRFVTGHKKLGGIKKGNKSIRQTRQELLGQLQPFINEIGNIIEEIDAPEDKILALTRMMKFCIPTYSAIEYTENTPRSLTAEEKLAQLNAKYNHLPDPTENTEEANDEEED